MPRPGADASRTPPPERNYYRSDERLKGLLAVSGILAAYVHRLRTGQGQVVEAAMSDGTLALMALFYAMRDAGHWVDARGANQPQGFAPFGKICRQKKKPPPDFSGEG